MHFQCHSCQVEFDSIDNNLICQQCGRDVGKEFGNENDIPRQQVTAQWEEGILSQASDQQSSESDAIPDLGREGQALDIQDDSIEMIQDIVWTDANGSTSLRPISSTIGSATQESLQTLQELLSWVVALPNYGFSFTFITYFNAEFRWPRPPAAQSAIEQLKSVQYRMTIIPDLDCTICKEHFIDDEQVIAMPCYHIFHSNCLLPWLAMKNSCPTCRYELPTDDLNYEHQKRRFS